MIPPGIVIPKINPNLELDVSLVTPNYWVPWKLDEIISISPNEAPAVNFWVEAITDFSSSSEFTLTIPLKTTEPSFISVIIIYFSVILSAIANYFITVAIIVGVIV